MTSLSPMLQTMISVQNSGAYNNMQSDTMSAPASQPTTPQQATAQAITPKTPLQNEQTDNVEFSSEAPKKKKPSLAKRLLKGIGIGGTIGFASGTLGAMGVAAGYEKIYLKDKSQTASKEFVKYMDKFKESLRKGAYELLEEAMNMEKGTIRDSLLNRRETAEDFVNFVSNTASKYKFKIGAGFAAAGALIGLGIGAVVHNVKKHKETKTEI